jgi:predicted dinucleotide-binding enzyme
LRPPPSEHRLQRGPKGRPVAGDEAPDLRLGIVGAGKIGAAIARAAVAADHDVAVSGSGDVERIELIIEVLAPGARAVTTNDLVHLADLIVLAVPMHRFRELDGALFAGKILVDAMNYWEAIDGIDEDLANARMGTSVVVQHHFPRARVVKSLNHLGYFTFDQARRPRGAPDRLAMAAAGNDPDAVATVMGLIDRLGFDPVNAGELARGVALQPGGPIFGTGLNADQLTKLLSPEGSPA